MGRLEELRIIIAKIRANTIADGMPQKTARTLLNSLDELINEIEENDARETDNDYSEGFEDGLRSALFIVTSHLESPSAWFEDGEYEVRWIPNKD